MLHIKKLFFVAHLKHIEFLCKKNSSITEKDDDKYWNSSHKRHSLYQKDSKSYKDFFNLKDEK